VATLSQDIARPLELKILREGAVSVIDAVGGELCEILVDVDVVKPGTECEQGLNQLYQKRPGGPTIPHKALVNLNKVVSIGVLRILLLTKFVDRHYDSRAESGERVFNESINTSFKHLQSCFLRFILILDERVNYKTHKPTNV